MPCYKLGLRFGDPAMVKAFLAVGRPGIYFAVKEEGVVAAGDPIERVREGENRVTVTDLLRLILDRDPDPDALRRVLEIPALAAVCAGGVPAPAAGLIDLGLGNGRWAMIDGRSADFPIIDHRLIRRSFRARGPISPGSRRRAGACP